MTATVKREHTMDRKLSMKIRPDVAEALAQCRWLADEAKINSPKTAGT